MIDENAPANWFSKPGDSIRAIMQRRSISAHDLAERFDDGLDTVRGLIDGSRQIDEPTASTLSAVLGATAKFWLKRGRRISIPRLIVQSLKSKRVATKNFFYACLPPAKSHAAHCHWNAALLLRRRVSWLNSQNLATTHSGIREGSPLPRGAEDH